MGYLYKSQFEQALDYLLNLFKENKYIDFDFFYDGTNETQKRLNNSLGYPVEDEETVAIIDITISELESMNVIKIQEL